MPCVGMAAGVLQTALVAPVEMLKIRQQLQTACVGEVGYVGPVRLLRSITAVEGLRGVCKAPSVASASATLLPVSSTAGVCSAS